MEVRWVALTGSEVSYTDKGTKVITGESKVRTKYLVKSPENWDWECMGCNRRWVPSFFMMSCPNRGTGQHGRTRNKWLKIWSPRTQDKSRVAEGWERIPLTQQQIWGREKSLPKNLERTLWVGRMSVSNNKFLSSKERVSLGSAVKRTCSGAFANSEVCQPMSWRSPKRSTTRVITYAPYLGPKDRFYGGGISPTYFEDGVVTF